jgi:hypothetical protein
MLIRREGIKKILINKNLKLLMKLLYIYTQITIYYNTKIKNVIFNHKTFELYIRSNTVF